MQIFENKKLNILTKIKKGSSELDPLNIFSETKKGG